MLCLFCGKCCRRHHPSAFHSDENKGCERLRRIGSFMFCNRYSSRPYSCVQSMMSLSEEAYCPFGTKALGLTIEKARDRREEGLKLIEELYGEKHGKRFNRRYQIN